MKHSLFQGNSSLLDNFIKDISELVKPETTSPKPASPTNQQYGAFKKLEPPPVIPVNAVQQFKNKAISTIEFAKLLESRLSSSASSAFIELDLAVLERICWKWALECVELHMFLYVYVSKCSLYLYVCAHLSVCLFVCLSVCACLFVCLSIWVMLGSHIQSLSAFSQFARNFKEIQCARTNWLHNFNEVVHNNVLTCFNE